MEEIFEIRSCIEILAGEWYQSRCNWSVYALQRITRYTHWGIFIL